MADHGRDRVVDEVRVTDSDPNRQDIYHDYTWLAADELGDYQAQQRLYPEVPRAVIDLTSRHLATEQVAAFYTRVRRVPRVWLLNVLVRCGSGLLRIRLHPQHDGHLALASAVYASTAVVELEHGLAISAEPGDDVVRAGTAHLRARLLAGGYESFDTWMAALLSTEGIAWAQDLGSLRRPSKAVGPLSTILLGVHGLREDCAPLLAALAEHSVYCDLLERAEQDTAITRTILPALAEAAASVTGQDHDHVVLANTGAALRKLAVRMDEPLQACAEELVRMRHQVNRVRMTVAAAHAVADVLGREALRRIADFRGEVDPELADLCRATEQVVSEMAVEAATVAEDLGPLAQRCTAAIEALAEFHRWIRRYRLMVSRIPDAANLSDLTAALDQHLATEDGGPLEDVLAASSALHLGYDVESLVGHLHDIRGAVGHIDARTD